MDDDQAMEVMMQVLDVINTAVEYMGDEEAEATVLFVAANLMAGLVGGRLERGQFKEAEEAERAVRASLELALSRAKN